MVEGLLQWQALKRQNRRSHLELSTEVRGRRQKNHSSCILGSLPRPQPAISALKNRYHFSHTTQGIYSLASAGAGVLSVGTTCSRSSSANKTLFGESWCNWLTYVLSSWKTEEMTAGPALVSATSAMRVRNPRASPRVRTPKSPSSRIRRAPGSARCPASGSRAISAMSARAVEAKAKARDKEARARARARTNAAELTSNPANSNPANSSPSCDSVRFNETVRIRFIPTREEMASAGTLKDISWSTDDFRSFRDDFFDRAEAAGLTMRGGGTCMLRLGLADIFLTVEPGGDSPSGPEAAGCMDMLVPATLDALLANTKEVKSARKSFKKTGASPPPSRVSTNARASDGGRESKKTQINQPDKLSGKAGGDPSKESDERAEERPGWFGSRQRQSWSVQDTVDSMTWPRFKVEHPRHWETSPATVSSRSLWDWIFSQSPHPASSTEGVAADKEAAAIVGTE